MSLCHTLYDIFEQRQMFGGSLYYCKLYIASTRNRWDVETFTTIRTYTMSDTLMMQEHQVERRRIEMSDLLLLSINS